VGYYNTNAKIDALSVLHLDGAELLAAAAAAASPTVGGREDISAARQRRVAAEWLLSGATL
jgi:hypothetical protein